MAANEARRFIVKLEVFAAAGPIDLDVDANKDTRGELRAVIEQLRKADPDDIEDQTYRAFRFDVCDACRKQILLNPLGHGENPANRSGRSNA